TRPALKLMRVVIILKYLLVIILFSMIENSYCCINATVYAVLCWKVLILLMYGKSKASTDNAGLLFHVKHQSDMIQVLMLMCIMFILQIINMIHYSLFVCIILILIMFLI